MAAPAQGRLEGEALSPDRISADRIDHQAAGPEGDRSGPERIQSRGDRVRFDEGRTLRFVRQEGRGEGRLPGPVRLGDDQNLPARGHASYPGAFKQAGAISLYHLAASFPGRIGHRADLGRSRSATEVSVYFDLWPRQSDGVFFIRPPPAARCRCPAAAVVTTMSQHPAFIRRSAAGLTARSPATGTSSRRCARGARSLRVRAGRPAPAAPRRPGRP